MNTSSSLIGTLDPSWIVGAIALSTGLSVALVGWLVSRAAAAVPPQDRLWLDPPPAGYRIVWWPVQWLAHYLRAPLPERHAQASLARLRLAGLDFALDPAQFLAGRLVWGLLCAVFALWLASTFRLPPGWPTVAAFALGSLFPLIWLRDRIDARRRQTFKSLPFMLDLITLCVESGLNLNSALAQPVAKDPPGRCATSSPACCATCAPAAHAVKPCANSPTGSTCRRYPASSPPSSRPKRPA